MNPGEIAQAGFAGRGPSASTPGRSSSATTRSTSRRPCRARSSRSSGQRQERIRGPYAAGGLKPVDAKHTDYGSSGAARARREAAGQGQGPDELHQEGRAPAYKGSGAGTYFIAFRRVGKTGWIIPKAAPRPFMRAALEGTADAGRRWSCATSSRRCSTGAADARLSPSSAPTPELAAAFPTGSRTPSSSSTTTSPPRPRGTCRAGRSRAELLRRPRPRGRGGPPIDVVRGWPAYPGQGAGDRRRLRRPRARTPRSRPSRAASPAASTATTTRRVIGRPTTTPSRSTSRSSCC
jgi:hypothetical protein